MTPQEERRKRLEEQAGDFWNTWSDQHTAGEALVRALVSLLEREIDAAVGQRDAQFHQAACFEYEGIQPMEALARVFGKDIPTAIIHETVKRNLLDRSRSESPAAKGTPDCTCHSGSVCGEECRRGAHHGSCYLV